jgi:hypothetical protein
MALGGVNAEVQTGGGQQRVSGAIQSRTVIQVGCSPAGDINTVYNPGSLGAAKSILDTGELIEALAMRLKSGLPNYVVVCNPGTAGDTGTVTHTGEDDGTLAVTVAPHKAIRVLCTLGGTLGTAKFKFSLDGGTTYGDEVTSTAGPYAVRVPGTYCTLTFAAATYVVDKTLDVATNGTVTAGSGWVGTVTQASSPIDYYEVLVTVITGGALGTAVVRISLDNGKTALPDFAIPSGGVVVIPGTGLVCTFASTFTEEETYFFLASPPAPSSQDLDDALDALLADQTVDAALVHIVSLPSSAANAVTLADSLQTFCESAAAVGLDWQAVTECPVVDDLVVSGGATIYDTADTDSTIRTARVGADTPAVAVHAGTHRMSSPITKRKTKRPLGWAVVKRFTETDMRLDPSRVASGPLDIFEIGRNEAEATVGLDDVQINTARTYRRRNGVFLSITRGGYGWKNLTQDADLQWATGVRCLNGGLASLRVEAQVFLGETPPVNDDGTIEEKTRRSWSSKLDTAIKKFYGLVPGGDFRDAQVSSASATVLASSQLGSAPRRLDIEYTIQPRGFVSDVDAVVRYSGVISVEGEE